jgi:hypothetical protein
MLFWHEYVSTGLPVARAVRDRLAAGAVERHYLLFFPVLIVLWLGWFAGPPPLVETRAHACCGWGRRVCALHLCYSNTATSTDARPDPMPGEVVASVRVSDRFCTRPRCWRSGPRRAYRPGGFLPRITAIVVTALDLAAMRPRRAADVAQPDFDGTTRCSSTPLQLSCGRAPSVPTGIERPDSLASTVSLADDDSRIRGTVCPSAIAMLGPASRSRRPGGRPHRGPRPARISAIATLCLLGWRSMGGCGPFHWHPPPERFCLPAEAPVLELPADDARERRGDVSQWITAADRQRLLRLRPAALRHPVARVTPRGLFSARLSRSCGRPLIIIVNDQFDAGASSSQW